MGLYLRKSFKTGPVRLNVSKSGLGTSVGGKGLRVGATSQGRSYVHAGRKGLYYRKFSGTGGQHQAVASGRSSEPIVLYEHTGASYGSGGPQIDTERLKIDGSDPSLAIPVIGLMVSGLVLLSSLPSNPLGLSIGIAGVVGFALFLRRRLGVRNALRGFRDTLKRLVEVTNPVKDSDLKRLRELLNDGPLSEAQRSNEARRAYLTVCDRVIADDKVTYEELDLLARLEHEIGADEAFCQQVKTDAYRGVLIEAIADHALTDSEEQTLDHIRTRLGISQDQIEEELRMVERLSELRMISQGDLPVVEPSVPIQKSEECFFEAPGRLLKEKQLRTFQQEGQRYKVRGLTVDKEGQLVITNKRTLLVHTGTSSVPHDKVLDVEVDIDDNVIRIVKDGRATPILVTTPDASRAGAIIARLSRSGERD